MVSHLDLGPCRTTPDRSPNSEKEPDGEPSARPAPPSRLTPLARDAPALRSASKEAASLRPPPRRLKAPGATISGQCEPDVKFSVPGCSQPFKARARNPLDFHDPIPMIPGSSRDLHALSTGSRPLVHTPRAAEPTDGGAPRRQSSVVSRQSSVVSRQSSVVSRQWPRRRS